MIVYEVHESQKLTFCLASYNQIEIPILFGNTKRSIELEIHRKFLRLILRLKKLFATTLTKCQT